MPVPMSNAVVMLFLIKSIQLVFHFWHKAHKALTVSEFNDFWNNEKSKNPFVLKGSIIAF